MPLHDTGITPATGGGALPTIAFAPAAARAEGQNGTSIHQFVLTLTRNGYTGPVAYGWSVAGTGPSPADAADFAGGVLPSGSGSFAAGESARTIDVPVAGDALAEADERFVLTASATLALAPATVAATLLDDDAGAAASVSPGPADSGAPAQGAPDNFPATFAPGTAQAWLALARNGVEETVVPREPVTAAYPWARLVPQGSGGGYTVRAYDGPTGALVGEGAPFAVAARTLPALPLGPDARLAALGDSTMAIGYAFADVPTGAYARAGARWLPMALRQMGYPVNADIWPNHHGGGGTATERGAGGGFVDAVTGDGTLPQGSGGGTGAYPGYLTRLPRVLMQRPALLLVQVTVNDVAMGLSATTAIANYQAIADAATRMGCRVVFVLMRPADATTLSAAQQDVRVAINTGVVALCGATAGCHWWDPSPVYTRAGGGASSYADAAPILAAPLIVGFHPTLRGAQFEADAFEARATALGLFTPGANYPRDRIVGGDGTDVTVAPLFADGDNAGVSLSGGAGGTWANGIRGAGGPGGGNSLVTGSIEANPATGGRTQVIAVAPAGSGFQQASVLFSRPTNSAANHVGVMEVAIELELTDPDSIVSGIRCQIEGATAASVGTASSADGDTEFDLSGGGVSPTTGPVVRWHKLLLWCDGTQAKIDYGLTLALLPAGRSAAATIRIRQHRCRLLGSDPRAQRLLPAAPTLAANGTPTAGGVPLRATLASGGVRAQGVRWWVRTAASPGSWSHGGEVTAPPGATTLDFTATGLTAGVQYQFRCHALRNAGVLGAGFGRWHAEGSPSGIVTATAG